MEDKKFMCKTCGSTSEGTPGECCGGDRKEVCGSCNHLHGEDGTCECGCGKPE